MDYETLLIQPAPGTAPEDGIRCLVLNRPDVMNAMNTQMFVDLRNALHELAFDDSLRVLIFSGAGERAFCTGGDLKERDGMSNEAWRTQHELFERSFMALLESQVPVIAAVNGHAYGGGCETVLGCDFVYASRQARFALSETKLGIMPGGGGTQTLARAVGERRAKELIFSARPFSAEDAERWGLVNRVCDDNAALMDEALATARAIAANAPLSIRQAKKSIHHGLQMDLLSGYRFEIEAYNRLVVTEDRLEGVRAFNEKRPPVFRAR